jgi:hypothetical protein
MDLAQIAIGAALAGAAYFAYLAATKGLPAAWAFVRAKWSAGKAEVAKLKGDLVALEQGAIAEVKDRLGALEAEVAKLKGMPAAAAAPAPPAAPAPVATTLWPAGGPAQSA